MQSVQLLLFCKSRCAQMAAAAPVMRMMPKSHWAGVRISANKNRETMIVKNGADSRVIEGMVAPIRWIAT